MVSNQQFRLKWNNHRNTVFQEFETLLRNNSFVDCTIGADGKYLRAHKIVLSACSPYLQNVFSEHFDKHPVILLKDVSFKELKCMIDYMYCGEVNITECELPSFLRTAQSLKIKGLAEDINEYDSASDNEHQEINSLTENGGTVEPNVEIHDDEPPCKKNAPSLMYSNFAGRKRKSSNNAVSSASKSSNNDKLPSAPTAGKLTGGNVPSCVNTDNSDNIVCTTSKANSVEEDANDSSKKSISQDDHQVLVKSKAVVKEEPVDGDDDNSSYEFGNNTCEDLDPLNEDSESNFANSGKNFTEVSIATSVSYSNESEANDDDDRMEIKEELLTEVVTLPDEAEERGIRVRSATELMPFMVSNADTPTLYVVDEKEDDNEIIIKVDSVDNSTLEGTSLQNNEHIIEVNTFNADDFVKNMTVSLSRRMKLRHDRKPPLVGKNKKRRLAMRSDEGKGVPEVEVKQPLRKILPAPIKPTVLALPTPIASSSGTQKRISTAPSTSTSSTSSKAPIQMISVSQTQNADAPQILSGKEDSSNLFVQSKATTSQSSSDLTSRAVDPMSVNSQIILINPSTRVVLPSTVKVTPSNSRVNPIRAGKRSVMAKPAISPTVSLTKFRKIAPMVEGAEGLRSAIWCKTCFHLFTDVEELKKHTPTCPLNAKAANQSKRGRRRKDYC